MGVPFIDIKRFESGLLEEWEEKVKILSKNASFIGGEEVSLLERNLASQAETKYSVACANGTDALQLALRALGVGKGDAVLLPDSTFWATFESVVNVGADPYTVDTDPNDLQMDFTVFEKALEKVKPKAAIIVHLYGWGSARLEDFRKLCRSKEIPLLEDGAQCYGVKYKGTSIYKGALIATTSFYPAKVLGGAGDGGAVFTDDEKLANKVRMLANHGRISHYAYGDVGWNSRLDTLQAAFLNINLKHLEARIVSRRKIAQKYYEILPNLGIQVIHPPKDYEENGYCNVTLAAPEERSVIQEVLKEKEIGFGNIYPGAMSDQPGAKPYIKEKFGDRHTTGKICASVLNYPLFPYMKEEELEEIFSAIRVYNSKKK
ncbi:DegT/DnrJ/EryC1/StrS aminotransferase family protein [Leptospira borgpetersenii]|uniref:DegT/DnrJ/EryC1/StrS aminotransferase family protein n=1 Tax=Leptospira borgpetersenii TaxID=174 RepID=UPI00034AF353|nr:DegT/DnrJ/EryC1/StrS family aminotransferase [Leptospira borgpetersenii]URD70393.1 DegT/DnrJ/EryC1/StrS family aminotransferase [Leptospira borgpetersenii]UVD73568.1 DegT/DnrJ/EryC1/StrS family aminotransferase [Leptospira borgpetersenii]UVD76765.1 DegT/DnrJ/EryC1/StrS family aminotransferase [Leptospira borgpetersenii]UZW33324.1 DegT/DnrJ/EryC1/StrS family aminotransferase [Leptospira borgpetersenii]